MMQYYSEMEQRAGSYRYFSGVFMRHPDWRMLEEAKESFGVEVSETVESAMEEYHRIMSIYPPVESLYTDVFNGIPAEEYYESSGLALEPAPGLPADHLGVELAFMSFLVSHGKEESQREFFAVHIHNWVPKYLESFGQEARGFYKEAALLLMEFIESEGERLAK